MYCFIVVIIEGLIIVNCKESLFVNPNVVCLE
jgi:hypothetical protein